MQFAKRRNVLLAAQLALVNGAGRGNGEAIAY